MLTVNVCYQLGVLLRNSTSRRSVMIYLSDEYAIAVQLLTLSCCSLLRKTQNRITTKDRKKKWNHTLSNSTEITGPNNHHLYAGDSIIALRGYRPVAIISYQHKELSLHFRHHLSRGWEYDMLQQSPYRWFTPLFHRTVKRIKNINVDPCAFFFQLFNMIPNLLIR